MNAKVYGMLCVGCVTVGLGIVSGAVKTATADPADNVNEEQRAQTESARRQGETAGAGTTDASATTSHDPFELTEAKLCSVPTWTFVGTVVEQQSYWDPDPANPIATDAVVEVTSVIHGSPPAQVELTVYGGVVDGQRQTTGGHPRFEVGSRYVLFVLDTRDRPEVGWDHVIYTWFRLPNEGAIPASAVLEQVWTEHCEEGSSPLDAFGLSAPYMDYVPDRLRKLCVHYNHTADHP